MDTEKTCTVAPITLNEAEAELEDALKSLRAAQQGENDNGRGCILALMVLSLCGCLVVPAMKPPPEELVSLAWIVGIGFIIAIGLMGFSSTRDSRSTDLAGRAIARLKLTANWLTGYEVVNADDEDRVLLMKLYERADPDLAIAILKVFAVVGDSRALELVDGIALGETNGFAPYDTEVRELAFVIASRIRQRLECSQKSTTLLRASPAPESLNLLRPVGKQSEGHEHLLRAEDRE